MKKLLFLRSDCIITIRIALFIILFAIFSFKKYLFLAFKIHKHILLNLLLLIILILLLFALSFFVFNNSFQFVNFFFPCPNYILYLLNFVSDIRCSLVDISLFLLKILDLIFKAREHPIFIFKSFFSFINTLDLLLL